MENITYFLAALVGDLFGLATVIFLGGILVYALWGIVLLISETIKGNYKTSLEKELKDKYDHDLQKKVRDLEWDFDIKISSASSSGYNRATRNYSESQAQLESDIRVLRIKNKELEEKNKDCGAKNCHAADKNVFITV